MKYMLIFLIACLAGCVTNESVETGAPPVPAEFATDKNYQIGVGDQLSIQVWRNPELSTQVPVRPDGKVSSPLVGDIVAAGVTTEALASAIRAKLEAYVRNPEVTVIITNPASSDYLRRVRVTGAVRNPVSEQYRQGMTVLDLVLQSGGITEFAAPARARLYRTVDGKTKVYAVDLDAILKSGNLQTNYELYPADVVTVPERNF